MISWIARLFTAISTAILGWIHLTELVHRRHRLRYLHEEILDNRIARWQSLAEAVGSGNELEVRIIQDTVGKLEKRKAEIENQLWKL